MNAMSRVLNGTGIREAFEGLDPVSVPSRGPMETRLEEFKERLLRPFVESAASAELIRELKWAATEATALAWCTAYPILVLPLLLEEKVHATLKRWHKQEQMRRWCAAL